MHCFAITWIPDLDIVENTHLILFFVSFNHYTLPRMHLKGYISATRVFQCCFRGKHRFNYLFLSFQWDLVCDKNPLSYLANSALFIGWAIGALILMAVADR